MFSYDYIPKEAEKTLINYKYQGRDDSILYKYVMSDLAQWSIDYLIPEWVAPNLITLCGLLCLLIPHLYLWAFYPNFEGMIPQWILLLIGFLHFFYQHLDNCDGKQARKTGNSTALGMCFDHNVDACVCLLTALNMGTCNQFGNSIQEYTIYLIGVLVFYYTTLEAYLNDIMILPVINGANEGSLGMASIYFIGGIMGPNFWNETYPLIGIQNKILSLIFGGSICILNLTYIFISIYKNGKKKNNDIFANSYFFLYIMGSGLLAYMVPEYTNPNTRSVLLILGFHNIKLLGNLQITHVSHQEYNQFSITTFMVMVCFNILTYLAWYDQIETNVFSTALLLLALFSFLDYVHFVVNAINQFCRVLQIKAFSIPYKNKYADNQVLGKSEQEISFTAIE